MPSLRLVAALLVATTACAHRTRIESVPSGAAVYVANAYVGTTPLLYSTPATELRDGVPIRVERPGHAPVDATLKTGIQAKRIVGGVFTLGLVPLFKWPRTYEPVHRFSLRPLSKEEALAELDARRASQRLTEDEYRALRLEILKRP
jgi:hypothetical protein